MQPKSSILKPTSNRGSMSRLSSSCGVKPQRLQSKAVADHYLWRQDFLEKQEENQQRREKVQSLLVEFGLSCAVINASNVTITKSESTKLITSALSLAESILGYYNITIDVITTSMEDSAMKITGVKDYECLLQMMQSLIPRIAMFPYSFIVCLGIRSVVFCEDISAGNPKHSSFYHNKLYNGIFPAKKLNSVEKINNHLYRVMMHNILHNNPKFSTEWRKVSGVCDLRSLVHKGNKEHADLAQAFMILLRIKEGKSVDLTVEARERVNELQRILKEEDPAGVNIEWEEVGEEVEKENRVFLTVNNSKNA